MNSKTSEAYSLAIVVWHDAHADGDSWVLEEEIDPNPAVAVSVGLILDYAKPGHLTIAQSHVHGHFGTLIHIPEAMVREITIVTTIDLNGD